MKAYGIFAILYFMVIYVVDICDSKCGEYVIVFQEFSCGKMYFLKPMKLRDINWKELTYPYNTTDIYDEIHGYKECMLEFDCLSSDLSCLDKIKRTNHATHSFIPGNNTVQHVRNNTKELDEPKRNTSGSEILDHIVNTKELDEPKRKTSGSEILDHIVNEEPDRSMYDVNLIYVNENDMQNSSNQSHIVYCDYAEPVCIKKKHPENYGLSDIKIDINTTLHNKTARTLVLRIMRNQNSTIQPIFTGYFPQSYNDFNSKKTVDPSDNEMQAVTITCKFLEDYSCKPNVSNETMKQINVHLKTNYIQNNTRTKYLNCTNDFSTTNNSLNLTCDAKEFANHNRHILITPQRTNEIEIKLNNQTRNETDLMEKENILIWNCQIMEINHTLPTKHNDYNLMYFKNCSSNINIRNRNKSGHNNSTVDVNNRERNIENTSTKDVFESKKTEISSRKIGLNKDNLPSTNEKNDITIHITESGNNCSHNSVFSIDEGKIIDLESNSNIEKLLQNEILELNFPNCINITSSNANNTQTHQQTELAIIMKNGSLNISSLKLINGTPKEAYIKERVILQCDHPNRNISSDTIKNKTVLDCEFIDLDDYKNSTTPENTTELNNTSNANNDEIKKKHNIDRIKENHNLTKVNTTVNENRNCSGNNTDSLNKCNTTRNESSTKVVENKKTQNDLPSKDKYKRQTFNRKKDIEGLGQNSLALKDDETDKIMLIVISSVAGASLLILLALKKCNKEREYNPAPTREPANEDEETAF